MGMNGPTRFALLALILFAAELLLISLNFDAKNLLDAQGIAGWFAYAGDVAKLAVLYLFVGAVFLKPHFSDFSAELVRTFSWSRSLGFLAFQVFSFFILFILSGLIFFEAYVSTILLMAWAILAVSVFLLLLLSFMPLKSWDRLIAINRFALLISILVSLLVWWLAQLTSGSWGVLSDWTFVLSAALLTVFSADAPIYVDAVEKDLGLGDFIVNIAPVCSGYEGIGLIAAFVGVYLYLHRKEFRFPRALLLLPIGITTIWLVNGLRIAVLISIGHFWSEDIAIGGFHSQAGWIGFILVSLAVLWLAGSSGFFLKVPKASKGSMNLAVACLLPLVVLLAVALVSGAFVADFDWFYPLRVIAVLLALKLCWPYLKLLPYKMRWQAPVVGVAVAVLWVLMLGENVEANDVWQSTFDQIEPHWVWIWLAFRFFGASITVPIAEELVFRGYLLARLSKIDLDVRGKVPLVWTAVVITSLAFGLLHGAWIAGTIAGFAYAWVRIRSEHIGDAIAAHAITNALLCVYALTSQNWSVL
jgi:exosortase E/protease (VPEID-CTERM system)